MGMLQGDKNSIKVCLKNSTYFIVSQKSHKNEYIQDSIPKMLLVLESAGTLYANLPILYSNQIVCSPVLSTEMAHTVCQYQ